MSIDGEKKTFVIRQTFTDVRNKINNMMLHGKSEMHFSIPCNICIHLLESSSKAHIYLFCGKSLGDDKQWSIDATVLSKFISSTEEELSVEKLVYSHDDWPYGVLYAEQSIREHLVNGNLTIECHVTINKVTGFEIPMEKRIFRSFNDESAKEFSDIVFKVKDQKFHVCKMYLAGHSSYFKSLLFGNFEESKQSEVELKDIDPEDFQKFMEVLYGIPDINEDTVKGILSLADMYDAKMVVDHCEKFLVKDSKENLKEKFQMAIQYKLESLKRKCMSEFKNVEDIASIIPEEAEQLEPKVWKELLNLSVKFSRNR